jgi:hypothetical protein
MHGLSLVNRDSRTTSALLPELSLPAEFRSTLHSPSASSSQPGPIFQSDLSLARNENPLPSPHSEVSAPGLPIRYPPDLHRIRFSPMLWNAPPTSAPLQGFLCPSGSKRSASLAFQRPTFAKSPISLRSPQPDSTINDDGHGSTFQVRYVSRGSLFSMNLLEPGP